jgi:23S rRNA pseudouridine2605 synthase
MTVQKARPPRTKRSRKQPASSAKVAKSADGDRLQKVMAAAGVASRRECEKLIVEGRVEVDRHLVTELGTRVNVDDQEIRVDGELLRGVRRSFYMLHKPRGVIASNRDPSGRPRVIDLVPPEVGRVFTVGRLDMDSEGLILLTNDGELANRLAHPRYGVQKCYEVQVAGFPDLSVLANLRKGVRLAEGSVKAHAAHIKRRHKGSTILEIVLKEGKNREIRRMLAAEGHKVQRLRRVSLGPLRLGNLAAGQCRELTRIEINKLRAAAAGGEKGTHKPAKRRSPGKRSSRRR